MKQIKKVIVIWCSDIELNYPKILIDSTDHGSLSNVLPDF